MSKKRCVQRYEEGWRRRLGLTSAAQQPRSSLAGLTPTERTKTPNSIPSWIISLVKKVNVAHIRLPSVGSRSWSRFLAVSLQVTWVINPAVGCRYFPAGLQLPPATLNRTAINFSAWWTEAQWVWTVCLKLLPDSVATAIKNPGPSAPESSTLTTRLPSHPH